MKWRGENGKKLPAKHIRGMAYKVAYRYKTNYKSKTTETEGRKES